MRVKIVVEGLEGSKKLKFIVFLAPRDAFRGLRMRYLIGIPVLSTP